MARPRGSGDDVCWPRAGRPAVLRPAPAPRPPSARGLQAAGAETPRFQTLYGCPHTHTDSYSHVPRRARERRRRGPHNTRTHARTRGAFQPQPSCQTLNTFSRFWVIIPGSNTLTVPFCGRVEGAGEGRGEGDVHRPSVHGAHGFGVHNTYNFCQIAHWEETWCFSTKKRYTPRYLFFMKHTSKAK